MFKGAWVTITRDCNLRCFYCYTEPDRFDKTVSISLDQFQGILKRLVEYGIGRITLTGGEPTIHPDFFRMLKLSTDLSLYCTVMSNGISFSDRTFLKEAAVQGMRSALISVKSFDKEQFAQITGCDCFGRLADALGNLAQSSIKWKMQTVLQKEMLDRTDEIAYFLKQVNVSTLSVDIERPVHIDKESYTPSGSSEKGIARMTAEFYRLMKQAGIQVKVKFPLPFCQYLEPLVEDFHGMYESLRSCAVVKGEGLIIGPHGLALKCHMLTSSDLGRVFDQDGQVCLDIGFVQQSMNATIRNVGTARKECSQCEWMEKCNGGRCFSFAAYRQAKRLG